MRRGKGALVTGAAVRLGAAIAERLAADGYDIAIHCNRSTGEAHALAARLAARGVATCVIRKDLASPDAGSMVCEAAAALGIPLGVLVNSASLYEPDSLRDLTADVFSRHMDVNVRAPMLLAQAFAAQASRGDSIVNILDQRVLRPTPHFFSYSMSKDALYAATIKAAQSFAGQGIRVNGVSPGLCLVNPAQDADEYDRRVAELPLGRGGGPDEIAAAVSFLVSGAPSVTGQVITVDGGMHLAWDDPDLQGAEAVA